jgi:hypothetical protein
MEWRDGKLLRAALTSPVSRSLTIQAANRSRRVTLRAGWPFSIDG